MGRLIDSHSPAIVGFENGVHAEANAAQILNSAAPQGRKKPMRVPLTATTPADASPDGRPDV